MFLVDCNFLQSFISSFLHSLYIPPFVHRLVRIAAYLWGISLSVIYGIDVEVPIFTLLPFLRQSLSFLAL